MTSRLLAVPGAKFGFCAPVDGLPAKPVENGLNHKQPFSPGVRVVQPKPPKPFSAACRRDVMMSGVFASRAFSMYVTPTSQLVLPSSPLRLAETRYAS